jgi:hypothetical protein
LQRSAAACACNLLSTLRYAALTAGVLVSFVSQVADFFSFGTNDLTQMTFGPSLSRIPLPFASLPFNVRPCRVFCF